MTGFTNKVASGALDGGDEQKTVSATSANYASGLWGGSSSRNITLTPTKASNICVLFGVCVGKNTNYTAVATLKDGDSVTIGTGSGSCGTTTQAMGLAIGIKANVSTSGETFTCTGSGCSYRNVNIAGIVLE